MKMGATPFFLISLALLLSVASAARGSFMSVNDISDAEGTALSMEDAMDLHELAKSFEDEVSSFLGFDPNGFTEACLEISRKAKQGIQDQSMINEMDSLASALCYILPSDLVAELKANGSCTVCRGILDGISTALGNTDKQLVIILYLIKACKIQTFADQCKRMVFTFGPAVITAMKELVSKDLCFTVKICDEARNVTEYASPYDNGSFGSQYHLQSHKLGNLLDLM